MSKNFVLNFQESFYIDVTPNTTATYKRIASGITSADASLNENVDQTAYLDGDGYGSSEVIGAQMTISFSGHRDTLDDAQNYIAGIAASLGTSRKTNFKYIAADGSQKTGSCTICNIDIGGGDAGGKQEISFEIHLNGKPTVTPIAIVAALTATVAQGAAIGTTKFTATAGGTNTLAYKLTNVTQGTIYNLQYLDGYVDYTTGSDIIATAGQFLGMYEIDTDHRVVKFLEHTLISGDINNS